MDADNPTNRKPWRGLVLVTALALLLTAIAVVVLVHHRADATILRHRATFREEEEALARTPHGRAVLVFPALAGTAEDAADRFAAAVEAVSEEERNRLSTYLDEGVGTTPSEEQDRTLAAHPEPLAVLGDVLRAPSRSVLPRLDWVDEHAAPALVRRAEAARWAEAALLRAIGRSDAAAALRIAGELATLGADVERGGGFMAALTGAVALRRALDHVGEVLRGGHVSAADARELARILDALEAARPPLVDVLALERANFRGMWSSERLEGDTGPRNVGWRHLWSLKVYRAAALDEGEQAMGEIESLLTRGVSDPRHVLSEVERITSRTANPVARMHLWPWELVLKKRTSCTAAWRVVRTALAVSLHAAETGSRPPSLDALVPAYLPTVPIDPWGGGPLRYAPGPPTRVWSVGPDGRDDSGAPPADPDAPPTTDDFVIRIGEGG